MVCGFFILIKFICWSVFVGDIFVNVYFIGVFWVNLKMMSVDIIV